MTDDSVLVVVMIKNWVDCNSELVLEDARARARRQSKPGGKTPTSHTLKIEIVVLSSV